MTHRRPSGDRVGCGLSEHPETWLQSWRQEKRANFCPSWTPPKWVSWPWFRLLPGLSLLLEAHAGSLGSPQRLLPDSQN